MRTEMKLLTFDTGISQLLATVGERDEHLAVLRAEPAAGQLSSAAFDRSSMKAEKG